MTSVLAKKSSDNWNLSESLRNDGQYDAASNRLYYSLFQAVKAYAVKTGKMAEGDSNKVHAVAKRILKEDNEDFQTFADAMEMRVKADYLNENVSAGEFPQEFVFKADSLRRHYLELATA